LWTYDVQVLIGALFLLDMEMALFLYSNARAGNSARTFVFGVIA
jgi:hypothetical protein